MNKDVYEVDSDQIKLDDINPFEPGKIIPLKDKPRRLISNAQIADDYKKAKDRAQRREKNKSSRRSRRRNRK